MIERKIIEALCPGMGYRRAHVASTPDNELVTLKTEEFGTTFGTTLQPLAMVLYFEPEAAIDLAIALVDTANQVRDNLARAGRYNNQED